MNKKNGVILAVLGVVAIVALYGGYIYWTGTPQYSLKQAACAIKNHDAERFQQYVDIDGILDSAITITMGREMEKAKDKSGAALAAGMFMMMKPTIIGMAKQEIISSIERGGTGSTPNTTAAPAPRSGGAQKAPVKNPMSYKDILKDKGLKGIDYVKKEGKAARVGIRIEEAGKEVVVELLMRRYEGHWQVSEISNLRELIDMASVEVEASATNQ